MSHRQPKSSRVKSPRPSPSANIQRKTLVLSKMLTPSASVGVLKQAASSVLTEAETSLSGKSFFPGVRDDKDGWKSRGNGLREGSCCPWPLRRGDRTDGSPPRDETVNSLTRAPPGRCLAFTEPSGGKGLTVPALGRDGKSAAPWNKLVSNSRREGEGEKLPLASTSRPPAPSQRRPSHADTKRT